MTNRTAARRYARALFDVSLKEADPQQVGRELEAFVELLRTHTDLGRVLTSPAVPAARKRAVVEALVERDAPSPVLAKLLVLLAERDRLVLVPELAESFGERLLDHRQVVRAEVTSAVPLHDESVAKLRQSLARVTGREVLLDTRIDAAILGGVVARVGSLVFDGSVTRQLERMKTRLSQE
jgi:F-type H+-transporting ATPase subunit delta